MQLQPSAEAIRDTISAVFQQHPYDRSVRSTLLSRISDWIASLIRDLILAVRSSPELAWTLAALSLIIVGAIIARQLYESRARTVTEHAGHVRARGYQGRDPWLVAQELAAGGNFTEAAHALYRALLEALARQERLRLHPSKTVGDYARDLRRRSSGAFTRFREFARSYETVIYGLGECDRERYERLHALATPLIHAGG